MKARCIQCDTETDIDCDVMEPGEERFRCDECGAVWVIKIGCYEQEAEE